MCAVQADSPGVSLMSAPADTLQAGIMRKPHHESRFGGCLLCMQMIRVILMSCVTCCAGRWHKRP